MSKRPVVLVALTLAVAFLPRIDTANANPRAPPPKWVDPAGPPTDPDIWLKRLVGRYRVEGLIEVVFYPDHRCAPLPPDPAQSQNPPPPTEPYCQSVEGMGDCIAIGSGPGVQCIFNAVWRDMYDTVYPPEERAGVFNLPGGVSNLAPSMALFGLDPHGAGIRFLLVDSKGLAEGASGIQHGNRTTFRAPCVNSATLLNTMWPERIDNRPLQTCERTTRIDARPDARVLNISIDIEINDEVFTRYELQLRRVQQPGQGMVIAPSRPSR